MFHITENGPKPCSAEHGGCPYAKAGQEHFSDEKEAVQFYENSMAESYGRLSNITSKKNKAAKKTKQQIKAANVLKEFDLTSSDKTFLKTYKNKLSTASKEETVHTRKLQRVLNFK